MPDKITKETRLESYIQTEPGSRCRAILEALGDGELTARQIAGKLRYSDMNRVRPRITEMMKNGLIETCGKAYDEATERNVAVFRRVKNGQGKEYKTRVF